MNPVSRLVNVLRSAWGRSIRPARNRAPIIITRPDLAGLRGHIFNPFPLPEGRWLVQVADQYDLKRWPDYTTGFQELWRWEFVLVEHGVKPWDQIKHEEAMARHYAVTEVAA